METNMTTAYDNNPDRNTGLSSGDPSPAELDPELADVVVLLNKLGAADRASASASLESRVADASAPELGLAIEPLPLVVATPARSRLALRLAAAVAIGGTALAVWLASISSPSAVSQQIANNSGQTPSTGTGASVIEPESSTTLLADARTTTVRDWAAVSSLYEDNLSSDIDILAAEVSRLGSSLSEPTDASTAGTPGVGGAF